MKMAGVINFLFYFTIYATCDFKVLFPSMTWMNTDEIVIMCHMFISRTTKWIWMESDK